MKYQFPNITNISQVLPVIAGRDEFIVAEKEGDYTVINYAVAFATTFPPVETEADAILRECRGMIFRTSTGELLHRRLHKFFNAGEKEETQINLLDLSEPHVILAKMDGSMITPVVTSDGLRWGTKMGCTDVAKPVEAFVAKHPVYNDFARECLKVGVTPIFEWCSRQQRIVIDYPVDQLVLIAMRHNNSGKYVPYESMKQSVVGLHIPVVEAYEGTAANMQALVDDIKNLEDAEGFVVRFDSGHMVKVKGEWYCQLHSAKDAIAFEKNVIAMLVSEKVDDVKAFLLPEDLARVNEFEHKFWEGIAKTAHKLVELRCSVPMEMDRKTYAVEFVQKQEEKYQRFLYAMHGLTPSDNTVTLVKDAVAKNCGTQTKVDECRWMFNCNWNYGATE